MMPSLYILGAINLSLVAAFLYSLRMAREERRDLENRLMAITRPEALVTKQALEDNTPAEVDYVDESKEYALGNGNVDLLGDE